MRATCSSVFCAHCRGVTCLDHHIAWKLAGILPAEMVVGRGRVKKCSAFCNEGLIKFSVERSLTESSRRTKHD